MSIAIILLILIVHWFADFVMQSDKEAKGKSRNFKLLLSHVGTYTGVFVACMLVIARIAGPISASFWAFLIKFAFITFVSHLAIDYYTSRVHRVLYEQKKHHEFFTSIGFDQLLHYAQLFLTFDLLK